MDLKQKLADTLKSHSAARAARRRRNYLAWRAKHYKASKGHHPCEARGTATKNTASNGWNIRPAKSLRTASRFAKLRAFKLQFGLA